MRLFRYLLTIWLIISTGSFQAEDSGRYISLAPHLTEILFELGVGAQIVGTVEHSDYPAEASKIPVVGNHHQLNIEAIVALEPDVVFVWPDGNPSLQIARLKKAGLKLFESAPATIDDLREEIIAIGEKVHRSQTANAVAEVMRKSVTSITEQYRDQSKVSVYYELWYQPLRTLGSDPWMNDLISRCGGQNIFGHLSQDYPLISVEAVVTRNPDLIISPKSNRAQSWANHWSEWPTMKAVTNQSITHINADWVHRFTSRSIKGLRALCEIIDNARHKDINNNAKK